MGLLLLSLLVACLQFDGSQAQSRVCTNATFPQELYVKEGSQNGTVILNVSDSNDVKLIRYPTPEPPAFIAVRDGYVYLNATLDLDGNREWCSQLENSGRWMIYLICNDSQERDVIIYINRTDDFPPEFTASFTQTIQEMKQIGSVVNTVEGTQVTDRDCMSNVQIGSNTVFAIESGNTDDAFALSGLGERSGEIVVHRLLDYDHGDRRFLLNISVTDLHAPNMTSYTTLEVNITDIDDNDPVFNDTHYELRVQEKNQSAKWLWTSTDPPLAVFDPDVDVVPTDPLTISLLNPNDTSILEVNKTTGLIRLFRIFDREQQASFSVVLKVQQTINSFRSSTTTLTVLVDDINDNRPLFQPYTYDVTMAEHSASGTSVAVVFATDKDLGNNAAFNYTLESGESMFLLTTEEIDQLRFGVLSVRDPALLDRENSSHIMVTVSTTELTAIDGQQCSGVHCNATVNITLLDINDNSPVFGQSRYDVVENSIQPHVVIITVNATDADEGANAKLTYKLQSFAAAGCHDVIIDRYSGDVSFNNTVTQSEECPVLVTACDNPADPSQRRCTFVPLQISVHIPNVRLEAPVPPDVLRADRAALQRNLSAVLDVRITINDILNHTDRGSSSLDISARNTSTQETLSTDILQRLVDGKAGEIAALFARYKPTTTTPPPDDFPPLVIALFVVAAVLLVAFAVAIVYICTGHKSQQRQKRLLQRLLTAHGLYRNVDDVGKVESGEACLLHQTGQKTTRGVEVVNPVFQDDGAPSPPSSPEVTPRTDSFPDTLDGRRLSQTATTELKGRVPRETDSGVPSDRENGAESGSDSGSESVSVPSGERSADRSAGSAYLEAVLSSSPLPESGGIVHSDDTVDVTAAPSHYDVSDATADACAPNAAPSPSLSPPSPSLSPLSPSRSSPTYVNVNPGSAVVRSGDLPVMPAGYEEQETRMTFQDNDAEVESSYDPLNPTPGLAEGLTHNPADDNDDNDDDETGAGSRLGLLVKPSTPPMRRRPGSEREGEVGEEGVGLPEEPEPDYAKKVRFSSQKLQHDGEEKKNGVDDEGDVKGERLGGPGEQSGLVEEIDGAPSQLREDDEPSFHFNIQDELTAL